MIMMMIMIKRIKGIMIQCQLGSFVLRRVAVSRPWLSCATKGHWRVWGAWTWWLVSRTNTLLVLFLHVFWIYLLNNSSIYMYIFVKLFQNLYHVVSLWVVDMLLIYSKYTLNFQFFLLQFGALASSNLFRQGVCGRLSGVMKLILLVWVACCWICSRTMCHKTHPLKIG